MSFDMKYGVLQVLNTCIVFYRLAGFKYVLVHFDPWIPPSDNQVTHLLIDYDQKFACAQKSSPNTDSL